MAKPRMVRFAETWTPDPDDPLGEDKRRLVTQATPDDGWFPDPMMFYRYAFQFLVGDLLTVAWPADLAQDQQSTQAAKAESEEHLRTQNSGLAVSRLGSVKFSDSSKTRLVQLADLVAGAVRRSAAGEALPLREIEDKMINLQFWPPR